MISKAKRMAQGIDSNLYVMPRQGGRLFSKILSQTIPGAGALALSALFGVWTLYLRPAAPDAVKAPRVAAVASNPYGGLFDPRSISGSTPAMLAQNLPLELNPEPAPPTPSAAIPNQDSAPPASARAQFESAPLPIPRPSDLGALENRGPFPAPGRRLAQQGRRIAPPVTAADNRTFFEKLFGSVQPPGPALAYAAPEDGVLAKARSSPPSPASGYDRWTAVYDVAAHTVYMPDGTRLEAHSGLGARLDDPRYVNEKNRGATPPSVYALQPREQLFHGVQALRLIPTGGGDVYGRTGLLAHTYMLGPHGDSNGCVSFRNYNAFLQAYQNGEIKRLVVVARVN